MKWIIREKIILPAGMDKMEIVTADNCKIIKEDDKFYIVRK